MWNLLIGPVSEVVNTVLKRVLPAEKMPEAERARLEAEVALALTKQDWTQVEAELKDRESARTLAAADVARGNAATNILAATVRPSWGYGALALVGYVVVAPTLGLPKVEVPEEVWGLLKAVVSFLFGGRSIEKVASMYTAYKTAAATAKK